MKSAIYSIISVSLIIELKGISRLLQEADPCVQWKNCGSYTPDGCNICGCPKDGLPSLCALAACPEEEQTEPECKICSTGFMLNPFTKECDDCRTIQCNFPICKPGETLEVLPGNCCPTCQERDCTGIFCDIPVCGPGEVTITLPGQCCPSCQKISLPIPSRVGCGIDQCVSYYDGCNECLCADDGLELCTQRECPPEETGESYCTGCESPWKLNALTKTCEPLISCICIKLECKPDEEEVIPDGECCPICQPKKIIIIEPPPEPLPTLPTISCKNVLCASPAICYDTSQGPRCCDPKICQSGECGIGGLECENGYECVQDPNNGCDLSTKDCIGVCVDGDAEE